MELFDLDGQLLTEEQARLYVILGQNQKIICNKLDEMIQDSIKKQLRISAELIKQEKTELELRKLAKEEGIAAGILKVKTFVENCEKVLTADSGRNK